MAMNMSFHIRKREIVRQILPTRDVEVSLFIGILLRNILHARSNKVHMKILYMTDRSIL